MNYHWPWRFEYGYGKNIYNNKNPLSDRPSFFDFDSASNTRGLRRPIRAAAVHRPAQRARAPCITTTTTCTKYFIALAAELMYTIFSWRLCMWIRYPPLFSPRLTLALYFFSFFLCHSPSPLPRHRGRRSIRLLFSFFTLPVKSPRCCTRARTQNIDAISRAPDPRNIFNWNWGVNMSSAREHLPSGRSLTRLRTHQPNRRTVGGDLYFTVFLGFCFFCFYDGRFPLRIVFKPMFIHHVLYWFLTRSSRHHPQTLNTRKHHFCIDGHRSFPAAGKLFEPFSFDTVIAQNVSYNRIHLINEARKKFDVFEYSLIVPGDLKFYKWRRLYIIYLL